jgi:hypothetical protein
VPGQTIMARRVPADERIVAAAPGEAAGDGRAEAAPPPRISRADILTIAASRPAKAARAPRSEDDAAGEPLDDATWLRVPRGIAVGLLLATLFWAALAGLGVWLLW